MQKAIAAAGDGQLLVPSFQGSRVEGMDREAYIADHVTTAHFGNRNWRWSDGNEHQLPE